LFTRDDGWALDEPLIIAEYAARAVRPAHRRRSTHHERSLIMANVNIKPLEDKVLVQIAEAETTTASGLVIPDSAAEKPQEAVVIAVGPGRLDDNGNRIAIDVKEGDTVVFSKYGGTELKYNGEEYLLLSARDLLAVVEK